MRKSAWILSLALAGANSFALETARAGAQEDGGSVAFTEKDQMFFDARQAMRQGRYDVAILTCEKILRKDADDAAALEIMGSAYYLMNEPKRARQAWERALTLDPDNPDIPNFLARLPNPAGR